MRSAGLAPHRLMAAAFAAVAFVSHAAALEWSGASLPSFAQQPASNLFDLGAVPSGFAMAPWSTPGLTTSTSAFRLTNNLLLGVTTSNGPSSFASGLAPGFDLSSTSVKLGYDLGRLTPFVTTSVSSARASAMPGFPTSFNTTGDLLFGRTDARDSASVGAGFNYELTDKIHVGVSASVGTGRPNSPLGW